MPSRQGTERMDLFRASALTLCMQVAQLVAALGVAMVVIRAAGVEGQGAYALALVLASLAVLLGGLGMNTAAIHYVAKAQYPLQDVVGTAMTSSLVLGVLASAVLGVGYLALRDSYLRDLSGEQIGIVLAAVPALQLSGLLSAVVLGAQRPVAFAAVGLTQLVATLAAQLIFLASAGRLTVTSAVAAWGLGTLAALAVGLVLVGRVTSLQPRTSGQVLRSLLLYGLKGYVANVLSFFNYRLDFLIVISLLGVTSGGYYSVAVALGEVIWYIANAVSTVMFPHFSSASREEANRLTPVVCRNTLFITFLTILAMVVVSHTVVTQLFTRAMLPALHAFYLLLPGVLALSLGKVISSYLGGIGKPVYATYTACATALLTVILDLLLIPPFGIGGAATASSVVYTVATAAVMIAFMAESGSGFWEAVLVQPEDFRRCARLVGSTFTRLAYLRVAGS